MEMYRRYEGGFRRLVSGCFLKVLGANDCLSGLMNASTGLISAWGLTEI
jgi:hypothetical protein